MDSGDQLEIMCRYIHIRRDGIGCYPQESALKEAHNGTQRCPSQDGVLPFAFERRPAVAVASPVPGSVDCKLIPARVRARHF